MMQVQMSLPLNLMNTLISPSSQPYLAKLAVWFRAITSRTSSPAFGILSGFKWVVIRLNRGTFLRTHLN